MVVRDSLRPFVTSNISLLRTPVRGYISSLSRGEVDLLKKKKKENRSQILFVPVRVYKFANTHDAMYTILNSITPRSRKHYARPKI